MCICSHVQAGQPHVDVTLDATNNDNAYGDEIDPDSPSRQDKDTMTVWRTEARKSQTYAESLNVGSSLTLLPLSNVLCMLSCVCRNVRE